MQFPNTKKNEQIVHAALFADGDALQYADPERQRREAAVILAAMKARTAGVLNMADNELQADREKPEVVLCCRYEEGQRTEACKKVN